MGVEEELSYHVSQQKNISMIQHSFSARLSDLQEHVRVVSELVSTVTETCTNPVQDDTNVIMASSSEGLDTVRSVDEVISQYVKLIHVARAMHEPAIQKYSQLEETALALQQRLEEVLRRYTETEENLQELKNMVASTGQMKAREGEQITELFSVARDEVLDHISRLDLSGHVEGRAMEAFRDIATELVEDLVAYRMGNHLEAVRETQKSTGMTVEQVQDVISRLWETERGRCNDLVPQSTCTSSKHDGLKSDSLFPDHALHGAGARVVSQLTSDTYVPDDTNPLFFAVKARLGMETGVGYPEEAISSDSSLGHCWAMAGSEGFLTVKLLYPLNIHSITLDHISREDATDITTAPKDFEVYGMSHENEPFRLVYRGRYDINAESPVQHFALMNPPSEPMQYVRIKVLSNHGNPDFTCLYRFRVHGDK
eukprot:CAMPEP_0185037140 /NCGR_PEP_ID=MMETSP1103-20130426/31114_1 /TAXON_ID=36769 /ORGANISM="Paraphysomonas bandaiensis, Strain Caron Lab Isolate" /LENGTH=426 /DNA_ID=CAMNT_0027574969 /DNA_START=222 /DNA_END=1502 /DNA_ORIENTATION=+